MARFCGIYSPNNPALMRREDLRAMLGAFLTDGPVVESEYFDEASGFGITALSHDSQAGPEFLSTEAAVVAVNGYVRSSAIEVSGQSAAHAALDVFNRDESPEVLAGEFAIVHWSKVLRKMTLATDPIGKWPLFTLQDPTTGVLLFASEVKCLLAHPAARREIDHGGLGLYLFGHAVPAPFTAWSGIRRLHHGEKLEVSADGSVANGLYWSFAQPSTEQRSALEWSEHVHANLTESIRAAAEGQSRVALWLGAGRDSSLIYGLLKTRFPDIEVIPITGHYEEGRHKSPHLDLPYARRLAAHWGDDLVEVELTLRTLGHRLELLLRQMDQPFYDFANNVTYDILTRVAMEKGATVALTGQGAGEVYSPQSWRGVLAEQAEGRLQTLPEIRQHFSKARVFSPERLERLMLQPPANLLEDFQACYEALEERVSTDDAFHRSMLGIRQVSVREHNFHSTGATMAFWPARIYNLLFDWPAFKDAWRIPAEFKGLNDATLYKVLLLEHNPGLIPDFIMERVKRGLPGYVLANGDLPTLEQRLFSREVIERQGVFNPDYFEKAIAKKNFRKSLLMAQIWLDVHVFRTEETFDLIRADFQNQTS